MRVCVHVWVHASQSNQPSGVGSPFYGVGSRDSGCQAWWQLPLTSEQNLVPTAAFMILCSKDLALVTHSSMAMIMTTLLKKNI